MSTNPYSKKPASQLKSKRISVQFTPEKFNFISERAALLGMTKASVIRLVFDAKFRKKVAPMFSAEDRAALLDSMTLAAEKRADLSSLLTTLRNDSTNLNQIAKLLNSRQDVNLNELIGVLSSLANQVAEIKDLVDEFNSVEPEVLKRILKGR